MYKGDTMKTYYKLIAYNILGDKSLDFETIQREEKPQDDVLSMAKCQYFDNTLDTLNAVIYWNENGYFMCDSMAEVFYKTLASVTQ